MKFAVKIMMLFMMTVIAVIMVVIIMVYFKCINRSVLKCQFIILTDLSVLLFLI